MMAVCAVRNDTTCVLSAKVSWGARGSLVCGGGAMHLYICGLVCSIFFFSFPNRDTDTSNLKTPDGFPLSKRAITSAKTKKE